MCLPEALSHRETTGAGRSALAFPGLARAREPQVFGPFLAGWPLRWPLSIAAIADNVGHQDRRELSRLAHGATPPRLCQLFRVVRAKPLGGIARTREQCRSLAWAWLHIHAALRRTWKQGVQVLRVDWPVYPRRAEHNTAADRGNRRSAVASSSQIRRSPRSFGQLPRGGMFPSLTSRSARKLGAI
jgi:hypothetical protein